MTKHTRYNATEKGAARRARYEGTVKALSRRLADTHRKRDRRSNGPRPSQ